MTTYVNESSTAYLSVAFKDKDGLPDTPTTVSYSIKDMHTNRVIRESTAVQAASTIEITLTPEDTAIQDQGHAEEVRRVTIVATYGLGAKVTEQFDFHVVNLSGVV